MAKTAMSCGKVYAGETADPCTGFGSHLQNGQLNPQICNANQIWHVQCIFLISFQDGTVLYKCQTFDSALQIKIKTVLTWHFLKSLTLPICMKNSWILHSHLKEKLPSFEDFLIIFIRALSL